MNASSAIRTPTHSLCEYTLPDHSWRIVLDTNVALDWLLFDDARVRPLAEAVRDGRLDWVASPSMRDEFVHVLERGLAGQRGQATREVVAVWDRHAQLLPEAPVQPLRCTDPDDQRFVDLAIAARARWLVTRDKALLRLARPAMVLGLTIAAPARWGGVAAAA